LPLDAGWNPPENFDSPQSGRTLVPSDSEIPMRKKVLVYCEACGGSEPSGASDFVVFHCLMFCSPGCRDEYRIEHEARPAKKKTAATPAPMPRVRHPRAA
jgi:hypothetical protein